MHRTVLCAGAVLAALPATLAAQDWVRVFPTNSPPANAGHGMAYDAINDRTVLYGGGLASGRTNQTWLFDGLDWSQATPAVSPPPRAGHPLAYDTARGQVLLFGGVGVGTGVLADTWVWDGTNWTQMTPTLVPPARRSHPLVYHPGRATCVVHGGYGATGTLTDTWEWNGIDWQQIVTASYPTPLRYAADMAYDPAGNGLVLFSGYPGAVQDTWYFDNTDWALRTTTTMPPGRWDHTMVTDSVRNRVVLFGGTTGTAALGDTWEFDGVDWILMSPNHAPPARSDDYLAYDTLRGQVMMFGGSSRNDTWVYQTPAQPGFATGIPYGEGCIDAASASFYEHFLTGAFDLNSTTLQFVPTGNGYVVLTIPGVANWYTPVSANLGLIDETVSGPHALGFTLNYPGGSTSDIYISSNGYAMVTPTSNAQYFTNTRVGYLFSGPARWCPYWSDLNPATGGTVTFEIDPATSAAVATFDSVPEYGGSAAPQTFQVAFFPNGTIEMRLQACGSIGQPVLVGWSPGNGAKDPGSIDISAQTGTIMTSPDKDALWHRATLRPVTGGSVPLVIGPIPPAGLFAAVVFGLTQYNPGVDLTPLGMPGCFQYVSSDVPQLVLPSGGLAQAVFTIPAAPTLAGVAIKTQGAVLVPGYNARGAITSNGLVLTIDVN
jgi:hypothetical protein